LNIFELCRVVYLGQEFEFVSYAKFSMFDARFSDLKTGFDYSFYECSQYASIQGMLQGVKRTCQVPVMSEGGFTYVCSWSDELNSVVSGINSRWIILTPDAFCERFYHQGRSRNG